MREENVRDSTLSKFPQLMEFECYAIVIAIIMIVVVVRMVLVLGPFIICVWYYHRSNADKGTIGTLK